MALYAAGIIFFSFFYTAVVFNPEETAENLKKYGGFVPGIRPGEKTSLYLDNVLTRLTVVGAAYLTLVCLLPEFLISRVGMIAALGGTCHSPVAALARLEGEGVTFRGQILAEDGSEVQEGGFNAALHEAHERVAALAAELLGRSSALAVDTEAMGLVHGRDRLCLVQISDDHDNVCCIRILRGQSEAPLLKQLMERSDIVKVFHFARFDVAALGEGLGIAVNPLFCTKVASRLARTYTNRHGLKELVTELCGVELDKGAQSSDWGRVEELSEAQLAYAANDVRYLLPARERLIQMLEREERLDLAQRSFQCIPVIAELDRGRFGAIFEHRC